MFTGIIEEIGVVDNVVRGTKSCRITVRAERIFDDLASGDSVAVNGVCLTADKIDGRTFTADVMPETMRRTTLGTLVGGSRVNLERAMMMGGRFGGHIVSGHVDGIGTIVAMRRDDNAVRIKINVESALLRYIVEKGSVTLDGISLTVTETSPSDFAVSIIPHTANETTLLGKKIGDKLNIECDIIGKYVEKAVRGSDGGITEDFLRECGF